MISVCDDLLLEDMNKQDELEFFADESFYEAVDTLFGFDGENTASFDSTNGLLFPQPITKYIIEEDDL